VSQLIDYVRVLIELSDKAVWSLASYNNLILHEEYLRNRIGIRHDLSDNDGPIHLKVDRLRRTDPPNPSPDIEGWLTVARDPFSEPAVQSLRTVVMTAAEAAKLVESGSIDPTDVSSTLKPKPGEELRDVIQGLDRFPDTQQKVERYLTSEWREWAKSECPRRETIDIYDRLFSLQQAMKIGGSDKPLEIVWGMGVARWKVPPNELDHPLVEQLVELELDDAGAILVRPRDLDPIAALKPFVAMENPGTDLVARFMRDHFAKLIPEQELSPFSKDTFTPVLRYACAQLDRSGRYHPDHVPPDNRAVPAAGPNLTVTDTWVLYARPRSDNFFIADLNRLKDAVETTAALPSPTIALVTEPSDESTYVSSIPGIGIREVPPSSDADSIANARSAAGPDSDRHYYFPKPFNDEQIAIVERLESPDVEGVVVQGPPGTGKTHTIANIICHYLATGRRVLVTSKSEGALAVLRDQIPDGIRDLAISLLTSEREGLKQLEATVNILASKIASLDPKPTERDIADSERRIGELRRRLSKIDSEMRAFADVHLRRIGGGKDTDGILPIELAERIVRDRGRYTWFIDRPELSEAGKPQFTDEDIGAVRVARRLLRIDLDYMGALLPSISDLPDSATLAAIHEDLAAAARIERDRLPEAPVMSSSEADVSVRAEALLAAVKAVVTVHEACLAAPWLDNLYTVWRQHGLDAEQVRPLAELIAILSNLIRQRVSIAALAVALPDNAQGHAELVLAVERAASGQRAFGIVSWGKSETRTAFAAIRILDKPPAEPDQWRKVLQVLGWRNEFADALSRWRALANEFSLPVLSSRLDEAARSLQPLVDNVNLIADAVRLYVPLVQQDVGRLFPYGLSASAIIIDIGHARRAEKSIGSEVSRHRLERARAKLAATKETLETCTGRISRTIRDFVFEQVGHPDTASNKIADDWARLLMELERARSLRPHLSTIARVADNITDSGAPMWAHSLRSIPVAGVEDAWTPSDWRDAWTWAQADSHLRAIDGRERLRDLDEQRRIADDEIQRLFHSVVRLRTLLTLKARITRRVDAALQMFLTAIRRIGKGTGKGASRLRRDARDAMESSYAAVPCWIMPTWRVSESLPATLASFDLVIFDEASQSDIGALPALLRAKKVLIVGDDKQVSPTAAFIEEQKIRSLRLHYLDGQPFGALMLPGNSLYELALACYPGRRIMLKEHFRCVEPIIRFSFQFYTDEIVPVRVPKASERLSPPLIDVHVIHGRKDRANRNFAEAEAIVDEIGQIVTDPKMEGRSIGVISLIGSKQAQLIQAMLLERIGEDAYLRHDIACGDSAVFQGKERDIMLLSMVECPETRTSKTALALQQRFNVALSRARDREYLFHSVTEEMLKPDDLKAKVLRHFKNPMEGRTAPAGDLMAQCQSGFERDVLARLLKLGYRVQPQVKVGPYSIDLVVEGLDDRRLAVELDGDKYHGPERWAEDLARQRVMERVGWRFWRCWGSSFRLDPEACIDDLVRSLTALDIAPLGDNQSQNVWTEFRSVSPKPPKSAAQEEPDEQGVPQRDFASSSARTPTLSVSGVEVGDRIQVQTSGDKHVRVVTLTSNKHDPDLGIISANHPSGAALLGAEEDEEIEFEIGGRSHRWVVLHIQKAREYAAL
jgi:very-short-patch-repair endonuclease